MTHSMTHLSMTHAKDAIVVDSAKPQFRPTPASDLTFHAARISVNLPKRSILRNGINIVPVERAKVTIPVMRREIAENTIIFLIFSFVILSRDLAPTKFRLSSD